MLMHFDELPYYLTVEAIENEDGDIVSIKVISTVHMRRTIVCPMGFSKEYIEHKPNSFRKDVLKWIVKTYGLRPTPLKYE